MSNYERILRMDEVELTNLLNEWAEKHLCWQQDAGETLCWLREKAKEE